jgi:hypothetical protein
MKKNCATARIGSSGDWTGEKIEATGQETVIIQSIENYSRKKPVIYTENCCMFATGRLFGSALRASVHSTTTGTLHVLAIIIV